MDYVREWGRDLLSSVCKPQVHKVPNYSGSITFCSEKAKLKNKEAFCHLSLYVSGSMALASFLLAQYAGEIDTDCMDFISHDCDRISPGVLSAKVATEQAFLWSQENKNGPNVFPVPSNLLISSQGQNFVTPAANFCDHLPSLF
jgi:hypothetical protein